MPGFNGTGPMTGGGRGCCTGSNAGVQPNYGRGNGFGRGASRGRGCGRGFGRVNGYPAWENAPQYNEPYNTNSADEFSMLRAQADAMKSTLDNILKRMAELEKTPET